ncbi:MULTISPECIES: hypothetical protein [Pseudomonas putida group]|uniref:hypothetical protein n=1 Tax=Pseudomonas putida group TaxID=136845 RepID=UPI000281FBD2|nr:MULTISPECIES: hypothetical protein [Pseudomonas putida group]EMR46688.1 hypothetical protein PPUTLS46_015679 [Pseudomonas putida LS46]MCE0906850.1 hypothetical protein [Pseudomonas alloputida]
MIIALAAISAAITAVAEAMAWIRLAASAEISGINNFLKLGMFIVSRSARQGGHKAPPGTSQVRRKADLGRLPYFFEAYSKSEGYLTNVGADEALAVKKWSGFCLTQRLGSEPTKFVVETAEDHIETASLGHLHAVLAASVSVKAEILGTLGALNSSKAIVAKPKIT